MLKNYLKTAWRNLLKNKSLTLINIIGLSLGLASIMTLAVLVYQYTTTDDFHQNRDRMYYLKTFTPDGNSYQQTTFPLLYEIQKSCPEVEAATHWQYAWTTPWLQNGTKEVQGETRYVDSDFFNVFSFSLKEGNPAIALKNKYSVIISEKIKNELFGSEHALGKTVLIHDSIPVTITGVLNEMPSNSSLKSEVFFPVDLLKDNKDFMETANWYNAFSEGYLVIKKGADPKLLDQKIAGIVKQFYDDEQKKVIVRAIPFSQLKKEAGTIIQTIITGAMAAAIFILLIIVINLLNLNIAMAFGRTKEVAIRQMIGSGKARIILQFCVENALVIIFSLLLGFYVFSQILLPQVNTIIGSKFGNILLQWQQNYPLLIVLILIAVIIIILAGAVPSWHLTSIKVIDAVKNKITSASNGSKTGNIFITVQFTLAIIFICISIILNYQIRFMKGTSLGFNKDDVVVVDLDLAFKDKQQAQSRFDAILSSLKSNSYVKSISSSAVIPTSYWENFNVYNDLENNKEVRLRHVPVDAGFTNTYEIPILAGRNFNEELSATEKNNVLINETAVKVFGWTNPIGKQIKGKGGGSSVTVVGVMKDFHYSNLEKPIEPLIHLYRGKNELSNNNYLSIRMDKKHSKQVLLYLEQQFKNIPARRPFAYYHMDELVEKQYSLLDGILKVTNYVATLTIIIACMGMLGLVILFGRKRVKEIGIRKVLGASILDITTLLSKDFLKLVFVAVVIAAPISWWVMNKWLQDFAYRITISWWMFLSAGILALLIALVTIGFQVIKAAIANPVKNLRTE